MDSGRRRRLLTRLHLARAPLPLPLLRRSDSLSPPCPPCRPSVLPSTLEFLCWCQGVRRVSSDRRTRQGGSARVVPTRSTRGRCRRGARCTSPELPPCLGPRWVEPRSLGAAPARRSGSGLRPTLNGSVSVSVRYMLEEEEEERNPLCVPTPRADADGRRPLQRPPRSRPAERRAASNRYRSGWDGRNRAGCWLGRSLRPLHRHLPRAKSSRFRWICCTRRRERRTAREAGR